ncbi:hypothetical protein AGABI1DRAFT_126551 [Agaricus bisporus var. burnettii JB137-S8]|uniref:Uncharacterized protein n=1 Tax=Agaricus bisporus var. burnettii (strain JB137-S8 / ATCC MYA-4627 / FGSC 10392) TaxID=597362 RepID=K5XG53_AGABU|nr:uncharacterized protein AGABI1DRAFT_126551 [Agaricus bisporus var. burnettii JB137-S8]EKM82217.1 hypothetical protein AGABI1DRAFT_126551 [Agaricus bisporus var. burnettii JB137-S8]
MCRHETLDSTCVSPALEASRSKRDKRNQTFDDDESSFALPISSSLRLLEKPNILRELYTGGDFDLISTRIESSLQRPGKPSPLNRSTNHSNTLSPLLPHFCCTEGGGSVDNFQIIWSRPLSILALFLQQDEGSPRSLP